MEPRGRAFEGDVVMLEDDADEGGLEIFCCRLVKGDGEFCSWRDFALVMTGTCCWRGVVAALGIAD